MKLFSGKHEPVIPAVEAEGERRVQVDGGYTPDTLIVAAGKPVRLVFHRHDGSPCSKEVVFPEQDVRTSVAQDEDVAVELPPSEPGEYEFSVRHGHPARPTGHAMSPDRSQWRARRAGYPHRPLRRQS